MFLPTLRKCLCGGHKVTWSVVSTRFFNYKSNIPMVVYDLIKEKGIVETAKFSWNVGHDKLMFVEKLYNQSVEDFRKDQSYKTDRVAILGEELSAAHFILMRGGAVKFYGSDFWHRPIDGEIGLPNRKVEGMIIEAIDASGTKLLYEGLENFAYLEDLRHLNVSSCPNFDDFCLNRLQQLKNLETLDVSGCPHIKDNGLACLHRLKNLKLLNIADLPNVKNPELMTLLLEEELPNCTIIGVDQEKINQILTERKQETELLEFDEIHDTYNAKHDFVK